MLLNECYVYQIIVCLIKLNAIKEHHPHQLIAIVRINDQIGFNFLSISEILGILNAKNY